MAKYTVLRPVELDGTLYLAPSDAKPPKRARGCGAGGYVPVDGSGEIELTAEQAAQMSIGQVKIAKTAETKKTK